MLGTEQSAGPHPVCQSLQSSGGHQAHQPQTGDGTAPPQTQPWSKAWASRRKWRVGRGGCERGMSATSSQGSAVPRRLAGHSRHWGSLRGELKAEGQSLSTAAGLVRKRWILECVRRPSSHPQGLRTMVELGGLRTLRYLPKSSHLTAQMAHVCELVHLQLGVPLRGSSEGVKALPQSLTERALRLPVCGTRGTACLRFLGSGLLRTLGCLLCSGLQPPPQLRPSQMKLFHFTCLLKPLQQGVLCQGRVGRRAG